MKNPDRQGFTLIELLTVIAIIAILASMIFTVGPRMIERAKLASLENNFNQVRTELVAYATKNPRGLPPGYGYVIRKNTGDTTTLPADFTAVDMSEIFQLTPYVVTLNMFHNFNMYDPFATGYNTDARGEALNPSYYAGQGGINLLEFLPVGLKHKTETDKYAFPLTLYGRPSPILHYQFLNIPIDEANYNVPALWPEEEYKRSEYESEKRPFVYIPVNSGDAKIAKKYFDNTSKGLASNWLPDAGNKLETIKFPATKLDAFVLLSVGPTNSTGGILTPPKSFADDVSAALADNTTSKIYEVYDIYYVYALRAYYLATFMDDNNENLLNDYRVRTGGKAKGHLLPDGTALPGPIIYHFAG